MSEVNLTQIEDEMQNVEVDSEDEAPVFLDLSGIKSGKDAEVSRAGVLGGGVLMPLPAPSG